MGKMKGRLGPVSGFPPPETPRQDCFVFGCKLTPNAADWELSLATGGGPGELRNHSALKHFVGDRSGHFIDKDNAHLRIALQKLNYLHLLW